MSRYSDLVEACITRPDIDDVALSGLLGVAKETARTYLSRAKRDGLLAGRSLPALPREEDWVVVGTSVAKKSGPFSLSSPGLRTEGSGLHLHLYNGHGEWRRDTRPDEDTPLHLAPFELDPRGFLLTHGGPAIRSFRERRVIAALAMLGDVPAAEISVSTGIPRSTVSRLITRSRVSGVLRHRYFPKDARRRVVLPLDRHGTFSVHGGAVDPLPLLSVAFGIDVFGQVGQWESALHAAGGDFAVKSARITGGSLMGTDLFQCIPDSVSGEILERFRRSIVTVLGERVFDDILDVWRAGQG